MVPKNAILTGFNYETGTFTNLEWNFLTLAIFCWVGLVVVSTLAEKIHKNVEKSGTILIFKTLFIYKIYVFVSIWNWKTKSNLKKYIIRLQKIKMVTDFLMFLLVFSAIVLATTKPTQQKIAKVKNYHSSLAKVPISYFYPVKIEFFWTHQLCDWFWPTFCSSFRKLLVWVDS